MNARRGEEKAGPAGVPAEEIVIVSGLAAAGLYERQAGKQTPIQRMHVGRFQKHVGRYSAGELGPIEKNCEARKDRRSLE